MWPGGARRGQPALRGADRHQPSTRATRRGTCPPQPSLLLPVHSSHLQHPAALNQRIAAVGSVRCGRADIPCQAPSAGARGETAEVNGLKILSWKPRERCIRRSELAALSAGQTVEFRGERQRRQPLPRSPRHATSTRLRSSAVAGSRPKPTLVAASGLQVTRVHRQEPTRDDRATAARDGREGHRCALDASQVEGPPRAKRPSSCSRWALPGDLVLRVGQELKRPASQPVIILT